MPRSTRPILPAERQTMIDLARGMKHSDIAKELDRPLGSVSRVISDAIFEGKLEHRRERDNKRTMTNYDYH